MLGREELLNLVPKAAKEDNVRGTLVRPEWLVGVELKGKLEQ